MPPPSNPVLQLCGLADLDVEPGSVDLILTDPPYPKEFLPLWGDLADLAVRALRPGGALVAMSGYMWFDQVMRHLDRPELTCRGVLACMLPGSNGRVWPLKIFQGWKPILWLSKGDNDRPHKWIEDRIVSRPDKRFHGWGQDVFVFEELVAAFSNVNDLVCDPFLGGGTTAVAAVLNHRRFVGCDVDPACMDTTTARLRAVDEYLATQRAKVGA